MTDPASSLPPGANAEDEGQRAGAAVKPSGQSAKQLKDVDALRAKTEAETKEGAEIAFSKAANVGGDRHNSSRRVTPLAPVNGFYDQRHVCETASAAALKFESELERLFLGSEDDAELERERGYGRVPRVTLAMKGLTDNHCREIAKHLKSKDPPCKVEQLWLNDNPGITAEGAKALAGALKENSSLKELYLHYTSIGSDGFKQLLEGCAKNSTLKKLECGKCGIDEKALDAIDAFCRARSSEKTLQHIGLFGNADALDDDLPTIATQLRG